MLVTTRNSTELCRESRAPESQVSTEDLSKHLRLWPGVNFLHRWLEYFRLDRSPVNEQEGTRRLTLCFCATLLLERRKKRSKTLHMVGGASGNQPTSRNSFHTRSLCTVIVSRTKTELALSLRQLHSTRDQRTYVCLTCGGSAFPVILSVVALIFSFQPVPRD